MFDDIGAVGNGHDKLVLSFVSFCIVATSDYRREILGLVWSDFRRVILGLVWSDALMPADVSRWHVSWWCVLLNFGDLRRAFSTARGL